jgi:hypothetical protein
VTRQPLGGNPPQGKDRTAGGDCHAGGLSVNSRLRRSIWSDATRLLDGLLADQVAMFTLLSARAPRSINSFAVTVRAPERTPVLASQSLPEFHMMVRNILPRYEAPRRMATLPDDGRRARRYAVRIPSSFASASDARSKSRGDSALLGNVKKLAKASLVHEQYRATWRRRGDRRARRDQAGWM